VAGAVAARSCAAEAKTQGARREEEKAGMIDPDILRVHKEIEHHLNAILPLFVKGIRLTFIARLPGNDNADMVLTIDDLAEVAAVIERTRAREPA
jgi:hypothetical protein